MKVCSLYGAGFYYMPGTDICIKIGGYVRAQYYSWGGSSGTVNAFTGTSGTNNRNNSGEDSTIRVRTLLSSDTRQQTEYGTLRTYMNIGWTHDANTTNSSSLYVNRAFIQLAGFTFGKAQSFFDILSTSSASYFAWPASDTGDGGINLAAYTAQFGNGFSGTISLQESNRTALINGDVVIPATGTGALTALTLGTQADNFYGNYNMPDFVANLRVDQAWGSAQVMAAVHQVRASYYGTTAALAVEGNGHPEDEYGWVVGAGVQLNASAISAGDKFQVQASYTEGALRYLAQTQGSNNYSRFEGANASFGAFSDGVYSVASGSIDLTKGWAINATYDHVWSQKWKTSLYGGYLDVQYSDAASAGLCGAYRLTAAAGSTCDGDWSSYWVGTRTQFNINASTYMGVDILYTKLNTANEGGTVNIGTAAGGKDVGSYVLKDTDNLGVTFRIHRDFLP